MNVTAAESTLVDQVVDAVRSVVGPGPVALHEPRFAGNEWAYLIDVAVFAVPHREYREMDLVAWVGSATPAVLDANDVLSPTQRAALRAAGCRVEAIGRGADLG